MKTIKKFIAYILWQQYANSSSQYFHPDNICQTFWLFLFGIILLPLTIYGNILNHILLVRKNDVPYLDGEYQSNMKASFFISFAITVVVFLTGLIIHRMSMNGEINFFVEYFDWYNSLGYIHQILLMNIHGIIVSMIIIGIAIALVFLLAFFSFLLDLISQKIREYHYDKKFNNSVEKTKKSSRFTQALIDTYSGIRNKYCKKINWDDIQ